MLNITLPNTDKFTDNFIKFFIKELLFTGYLTVKQFNKEPYKEFFDKLDLDVEDILLTGLRYILYSKTSKTIIISFNINIEKNGYNVYNLCSLIDSGNLLIKGSRIFTDLFNYMLDQIPAIFYRYKVGERR